MNTHINKKQAYIKAMKDIDTVAASLNIAPEEAAMKFIVDNIDEVRGYVQRNGQIPEEHPINLAAQACLIHENKIWNKVYGGRARNYTQAENIVLAEEQNEEDKNEASPFSGSFLGAIFKAGRGALDRINQKRIEAGKKPILGGEKGQALLDKINDHVELEVKAANTAPPKESKFAKSEIGVFFNSLVDEYKKMEIKDTVKKLLPIIIIVLAVVFILGRKSK